MKENFKILVLALVSLVVISCQDDDVEFGPVVVPTNFAIDVNVASDQSGNVQDAHPIQAAPWHSRSAYAAPR